MRHLSPMVVLVILALAGCGKKPADTGGTDDGGDRSTYTSGPAVTDWSSAGGVKLRVLKAAVRRPVTVGLGGGDERTAKEPELNVWVEVANASADKKMVFSPWANGPLEGDKRNEVELTDDKGNSYTLVDDDLGRDVKENAPNASGQMNPGEAPIVWVFRFERPVGAATELRLSARPPVENPPTGRHDLRIPAAAWKR